MTRNPDSAGLPDGVEVVRGELSEPETLEAALEGVGSVFLLWSTSGDAAAVDAIARHTRRVVYLSAEGVRDDVDEQTAARSSNLTPISSA